MDTYKNLCTQFYDLDKPDAPLDALKFYLEYAEAAHGPIFEPMCGTGRFLIPMLQKGFDIEGADASPYMLAVCKDKCAALGLTPKLKQEYLHQMETDKKYALIFIPSGSMGLFTDVKEVKTNLRILYNHLLPNGKLVFEVETVRGIPKELMAGQKIHEKSSVLTKKMNEKILLEKVASYNTNTRTVDFLCCYELILDNKTLQAEKEILRVRHYGDNEMDELLKQAGFSKVLRIKAYEHKSPEVNDGTIVYECIK